MWICEGQKFVLLLFSLFLYKKESKPEPKPAKKAAEKKVPGAGADQKWTSSAVRNTAAHPWNDVVILSFCPPLTWCGHYVILLTLEILWSFCPPLTWCASFCHSAHPWHDLGHSAPPWHDVRHYVILPTPDLMLVILPTPETPMCSQDVDPCGSLF